MVCSALLVSSDASTTVRWAYPFLSSRFHSVNKFDIDQRRGSCDRVRILSVMSEREADLWRVITKADIYQPISKSSRSHEYGFVRSRVALIPCRTDIIGIADLRPDVRVHASDGTVRIGLGTISCTSYFTSPSRGSRWADG